MLLPDYPNGQALAQEFLTAWQQAHGAPNGPARALTGPDSLAILLESTFSRGEHSLSRQSDNSALLEQYIHRLADQIASNLTNRVVQVTGRGVLTTSLITDIVQEWVMVFFKLADTIELE